MVTKAPVTPEQSAPIIAMIPCDTKSSAAVVAAAESTHVESALNGIILAPPKSSPESVASLNASSAPEAISGVSDSIGPVKPKIIPTLISDTLVCCCEKKKAPTAKTTKAPKISIL